MKTVQEGQALYNSRNGLIGYVMGVSFPEHTKMLIGGQGMQSIEYEARVQWVQDGLIPAHQNEIDNNTIEKYIEAAANMKLEPVDMPTLKEMIAKQASIQQSEREKREEELRQERAKREAYEEEHAPQVPVWAKAVIIGELIEDKSDLMSDYHGSNTTKVIVLGFSKHTRDLFKEMRTAAGNHPSTEHLVNADEQAEHREKYSMGGGYYLKDGYRHSNGWQVSKRPLRAEKPIKDIPTGEWCIKSEPKAEEVKTQTFKTFELSAGTRAGFIQIGFNEKPSAEIRNEMKSAGFRWSRHNAVWYGKTEKLPARYSVDQGEEVTPATSEELMKSKAEAMRAKAEALQIAIDDKMNPACANQNPTPRRARMAESMRLDGEKLQEVQMIFNALADMHETGSAGILKGLENKSQIESLLLVGRLGCERFLINSNVYGDEVKRLSRAGLETSADYSEALEAIKIIQEGAPEVDNTAQEIRKKQNDLIGCKIDGFFPTPKPVIEKMLSYFPNDLGGEYVLEPSAGNGEIADAIRGANGIAQCIEINGRLQDILELKGHKVIDSDFTEYGGNQYKYILMNPPFEKRQDAEHIQKAFNLLSEGGTLAAIAGEGVFFGTDKKAVQFQEFLEMVGAEVVELGDAFKEKGQGRLRTTGTHSRLIIISK